MPIIATGEMAVVDYNDSISLQMFISSNKAHTQIYSPDNDTYTPDWSSSNLVLTPQLFVTSSASDVITSSSVTSVTWYKDSETNANKITMITTSNSMTPLLFFPCSISTPFSTLRITYIS